MCCVADIQFNFITIIRAKDVSIIHTIPKKKKIERERGVVNSKILSGLVHV